MKSLSVMVSIVILFLFCASAAYAQEKEKAAASVPLSQETEACIDCHKDLHPGLVQDWRASRHAKITPGVALKKSETERRISATSIPEAMQRVAVGCYECHALNPAAHKDNFEHAGYKINVIVSGGNASPAKRLGRQAGRQVEPV
jgi:hydroxylamine dehydrogenase